MGQIKVKELNIERGMPTVQTAMSRLVNGISTAKGAGCKAVVVVHGYGSSGTGGKIKFAVKSKLREPMFRGMVRDFCSGEAWYESKKDFIDVCPQLRDFNSYIDGNKGITVVLLK